ncbi:acyltransferase [Candidatus Bipolaricaulota bacterium]|nr:acyltransferase [Candidatus Bipolaricaulota bacterium]
MRIGYVQIAPRFGEVERNLARAMELMGSERADLWVLPELFATGYSFSSRGELAELAEPVPEGKISTTLLDWAERHHAYIVAGLAESAGGRIYNAAMLLGPEGLLLRYRKLHLFGMEKEWFDPGDLPLKVGEAAGARIGIMVCFDHFFPEVARTLTLKGAQIICHPANLILPGLGQLSMRVRAMENWVFTVTANRIGQERRAHGVLRFTGESQIVAPDATVLVKASPDREEVGVTEVDPEKADDKRITRHNHLLADRRPDFYEL